jgi:hypothetical protein
MCKYQNILFLFHRAHTSENLQITSTILISCRIPGANSEENESLKCLLSILHSLAYTLRAVRKVLEVNSEFNGNQPVKAVV